MAQVDDELAIRKVLADMTADQPPVPPSRYAAVRRRAVLHRRRQLAGAAAAVAILVFAAIAVPLGLLHIGPQPPTAPSRHYHVSEFPPGPHSPKGLIAEGTLNGTRWKMTLQHLPGIAGLCWGTSGPYSTSCDEGVADQVSQTGSPASFFASSGSPSQADIGVVRSDVAYLKVSFTNGQTLTLHPVAVLGRQHARFVGLVTPSAAAVTEITAYSNHGELGYAVPFTGAGTVGIERWLRPGQPARPRPARYLIGSGTLSGSAWQEILYVGPWGTCVAGAGGAGGGSECFPATGPLLARHEAVGSIGLSAGTDAYIVSGDAAPSVSYLIVTNSSGSIERVRLVSAGKLKFFAYASVRGNRVVRWAAYDARGRKLASGTGYGP
jgi:hypothetical protein